MYPKLLGNLRLWRYRKTILLGYLNSVIRPAESMARSMKQESSKLFNHYQYEIKHIV